MIIAIDGPAASGKGTIAKQVAAIYGLPHLDTGLIYRAVAKAVLDAGYAPDNVEKAIDAAIALDPTQFFGHWALGMARVEAGAPGEAIAPLQKAHDLSGGIPFTLGFLAYAYGRAGRPGDARELLERAQKIAAETYVPPSALALGYVGLDDWDATFDWWNRAIEVRDPLIMAVKSYSFFDPVRGDPRYRAMLRRMNLAGEVPVGCHEDV